MIEEATVADPETMESIEVESCWMAVVASYGPGAPSQRVALQGQRVLENVQVKDGEQEAQEVYDERAMQAMAEDACPMEVPKMEVWRMH